MPLNTQILVEPPQAYCPACKLEVTFIPTGNGKLCPKCGANLDVNAGEQVAAEGESPAHTLLTWLVLGAVLLVPPVLIFLAPGSGFGTIQASVNDDLFPGISALNESLGIAIIGSGVAALFGAGWLVSRHDLRVGIRIGLAILLAPMFFAACLVLCLALVFVGCALSVIN